jgi:hypothetical protein
LTLLLFWRAEFPLSRMQEEVGDVSWR